MKSRARKGRHEDPERKRKHAKKWWRMGKVTIWVDQLF